MALYRVATLVKCQWTCFVDVVGDDFIKQGFNIGSKVEVMWRGYMNFGQLSRRHVFSLCVIILGIYLGYLSFGSVRIGDHFFHIVRTISRVDRPPGHLQRLGAHQPASTIGIDASSEFPDPITFFRHYVKPGKPLVFRQLATLMPAFQLWNDTFLSESFGHIGMTVETRKTEDRKGRVVNLTLADFISRYQTEELYLVESVPYDMLSHVALPRSVLCESFIKVMTDAILWFSNGGTKSVLHYDELDNINCLLDGSKEFFLVDKKHEQHVEINQKSGAYSDVDVDAVDMYRFPGLRDVPWFNVTLQKGDCLFIPYGWFHQVRSDAHRNLAVNIWFMHLYWLNEKPCQDSSFPLIANFESFDFCAATECLRAELVCKTNGTDPLTFKLFQTLYEEFVDPEIPIGAVFGILDSDNNGVLSLKELYIPHAVNVLRLLPKYGKKLPLSEEIESFSPFE